MHSHPLLRQHRAQRLTAPWRRFCAALTVGAALAVPLSAGAGEAEYRALDAEAKKYFDEKNYAKSLEANRRAAADPERSFGVEHALTLRAWSYLALNLSANFLHQESIAVNRRILEVLEKRGMSREAGTVLNNIASEYSRLGRYAEAADTSRRVLALRLAQLGPDHPQAAEALNYLALTLRQLGKYAEARPML